MNRVRSLIALFVCGGILGLAVGCGGSLPAGTADSMKDDKMKGGMKDDGMKADGMKDNKMKADDKMKSDKK